MPLRDLAADIGLASAVILTVYIFCTKILSRPLAEQLPLPPGAEWLWGHERLISMQQPGCAYRKWIEDFGLTFRIKAGAGMRDVIVMSDPGGISHVLQKKSYDYHHSKVVRPRIARLLGKGLGWVEGESEHKRMRRLVAPSLSVENMKTVTSDVREAAHRVLDDLATHLSSDEHGPTVNILEWMGKATLNVIGRVAFLHDFEGGNSVDAQNILQDRHHGVSKTINFSTSLILKLLRRFPILNDLPVPSLYAQSKAKLTIQLGVAQEMIRRNKDLLGTEPKGPGKDLLSRLLFAHAQGELSRDEMFEQISTFIMAGTESTTLTLGYSVWLLSRHHEVQERLRREIDEFSGDPTYEDFQGGLPYLDAVLKETLRMYPSLPYMERVATRSDVIPLRKPTQLNGQNTYEVPVTPGQTIIIPIIAIQRMDAVWDNADAFRPERWLETLPPPDELCSGWANLLAFSDGPRNCIGMRLAIFQYKVILSGLMRRFVFEDAGAEITLKISSSLQPCVVGKEEEASKLTVILRHR